MPKVIGQDQSVYKRIACQHCGAINEYTASEVRTLWSGMQCDSPNGAKGFNCAGCGEEIITERWGI